MSATVAAYSRAHTVASERRVDLGGIALEGSILLKPVPVTTLPLVVWNVVVSGLPLLSTKKTSVVGIGAVPRFVSLMIEVHSPLRMSSGTTDSKPVS